MIGVVRPLALYAVPMSAMKAVGEWVGREPAGSSLPRGASAPPMTSVPGDAAFTTSYVSASRASYAGAAASFPLASNCGSQ